MPLADFALPAMLLCVTIGAGLLWSRTRRAATLVQFVASVLLFVGLVLERIRWLYVLPADQSVFAHVIRSDLMHIAMSSAQFIGMAAFAISYLCYAARHKASNQAMQLTAVSLAINV
jgi:hypothetical protein